MLYSCNITGYVETELRILLQFNLCSDKLSLEMNG
jgi:hypothetical protein